MKVNITNQVRKYASVQNLIRKKQAQNDLGFTKLQVKSAVESLCKQGYLKRISHGLYEFCEPEPQRESVLENKIWRAIRINPVFTVADIAMQTESTTSYIYNRLHYYFAEKLIKQSGRKKNMAGAFEKQWRLTEKGRGCLKRPATYREYKPEPLIEDTVNLNRLVCSGRVICDDAACSAAVKLCQKIEKKLKQHMEK